MAFKLYTFGLDQATNNGELILQIPQLALLLQQLLQLQSLGHLLRLLDQRCLCQLILRWQLRMQLQLLLRLPSTYCHSDDSTGTIYNKVAHAFQFKHSSS